MDTNKLLYVLKAGNENSGSWDGPGRPRFNWQAKDTLDFVDENPKTISNFHAGMRKRQQNRASQAQLLTLSTYTTDSETFNNFLRGKVLQGAKPLSRAATTALQKNIEMMKSLAQPLGKDLYVYRGVQRREIQKDFNDKGFTSTSIDKDLAEKSFGPVVARIHVPKDAPVLWGLGAEKEVILPPNGKFTITKVVPRDAEHGHYYNGYELEYVP